MGEFEKWWEEAEKFEAAGNFADAEETFRKIIALNPASDFWRKLGWAQSEQGKQADACESFERALETATDSLLEMKARTSLTMCLAELGRLDEALQTIRSTPNENQDCASFHYCLGHVLMEREEFTAAREAYVQGIRYEPEDFAYVHIGAISEDAGDFAEAELCYRAALELNPECDEAHYLLGSLYADSNPILAEQHLRKAITLDPDYALAYSELGYLMYRQSRFSEAESYLARSVELGTTYTESRELLEKIRSSDSH